MLVTAVSIHFTPLLFRSPSLSANANRGSSTALPTNIVTSGVAPTSNAFPAKYPSVLFSSSHSSGRPISSGDDKLQRAAAGRQQQIHVYPDPIPEFAEAETQKFQGELLKRLSKEDTFGSDIHAVVGVCAEIFNAFLHKGYGGPGTLLIEPFTDMLLVLKERKLPGAPAAARTALLWAQNHVDRDWKDWTSGQDK